jgi:anthranilate phosphoribosyltransferase
VHSLDGYDEISLTDGFKVIHQDREKLIYPQELGLGTFMEKELHGGNSTEEAATIFLNILEGKGTEAQTQVVTANAGLALYTGKFCPTFEEAIGVARDMILSGKAMTTFRKFIEVNKNGS